MSWGHATSTDLTHWEQQPVAFLARGYPSNVTEMYFTGSAVADVNNTSGFGSDGTAPLVAMYTSYVSLSDEAHFILIFKRLILYLVSLRPDSAKRKAHSSIATIAVHCLQLGSGDDLDYI
jgi:hypothetical protein